MDRSSYLRVTSVLKPFTGIEFVPSRYLEPAANRGSQVHYHIQNLLSGFETPVDNDMIEPYLNSFARFWKDSLHAFEESKIIQEKRLYCDQYKISGQFDCLIITPEKTFIFDWKTSSRLQPESWSLQGAAYRYLCEVNGYENLVDPVFVKLDKEGKDPVIYKCDNYHDDLERFFNCLDLYRYFKMENRGR